MDGAGNVVFIAGLAAQNVAAIFKARSPDTLEIIASVGQQAPDITGDVKIHGFTNFAVNPKGDVAFAATPDGADARTGTSRSTFDDVAIFVTQDGALRLLVRQGDDTPGGVGGGKFETVSGVVDASGDLGAPLINTVGEVLFSAFTPKDANDLTSASLWMGREPNDLRLIVNTGDVTPTAKGDVTFFRFDLAVINTMGEVVFRGTDAAFDQGIWKWTPSGVSGTLDSIVEVRDPAPDTDADFAGFSNIVLNSAGQVAFEGDLSLDSPGVTLDNDKGIWAHDPDGPLRLIVREGEDLLASDLGAKNVEGFSFAGKSGNADGRPSGFGDNGDLAFLATFADGLTGVFRATFFAVMQPQGAEFIWSGSCGDDAWWGTCADTNWNDTDGFPVDAPPGDGDHEFVTIAIEGAEVTIMERSVSIEALVSNGLLVVNENLTLANDSSIEALILNADLTSNGKLTLSGESSWLSGTINTGSSGTVANSGPLTIKAGSSKNLTGTLTLESASVTQEQTDLAINGGKIQINNESEWKVKGTATISATSGGQLNIAETGLFTADNESGTVTISAPLDNLGAVRVTLGTLRLTGRINQVSGNALSKGTWAAGSHDRFGEGLTGNLEMPNHVIKTIGADAAVFLNGAGRFSSLKLESNAGSFSLGLGSVYETPGDLANSTSRSLIRLSPGGKLKVTGRLTSKGHIRVYAGGSIETEAFTTGAQSRTSISGTLSGPGGGSASFIFNGGEFSGSGTINGQRFDNQGKLLPGASPGVMTINADYTQFAEGTLGIEIGGTLSEVEHDQLIVNGNATLGGTLVLKFIDDFSPRTGQTFDFVTVDGNLTGAFDNIEVVDVAPAFEFEVTPTGGGMMMTAMNDGVFTGIVGEINDVTIGFNSPEAETTAAPGDTNVPMLQFEVVPEADGLSISELTFRASGSGDDVADVTSVTVWVDENGDGQVDLELLADVLAAGEVEEEGNDLFDETDDMLFAEGDRRIGSGTFGADDGTLILTIDPPLEVGARETVTLLVTYDLAGDSPSADESGASRGSRKNAGRTQGTSIQPVLALLLLPSILLLGAVGTRQRRASLRARVSIRVTAVLLAAVVWFPGCGGGDAVVGPEPDPRSKTLQVTLTGIGAQESDSDADASVEGLAIHGTILTVSR